MQEIILKAFADSSEWEEMVEVLIGAYSFRVFKSGVMYIPLFSEKLKLEDGIFYFSSVSSSLTPPTFSFAQFPTLHIQKNQMDIFKNLRNMLKYWFTH